MEPAGARHGDGGSAHGRPASPGPRGRSGHAQGRQLLPRKRYAESGQAAQQAIEKLRELPLGDSPELAELAAPVTKQLEKARELLGTQGVAIPDLKMTGDKPGEEDGVSFSRQVAPLLVAKCGGCHVQRARGEFSMATFATLFKGPPSGVVFMAGDAGGSRLVEVIESGDMPRGGGKLTDEELTLLKDWINAGAKFDGNDTATPLATLAAAASPDMPMPTPTVMAAGQDDAVQFARDVGPVLLAHCVECHGERNPPANFGVNTFQRLLNGGNGGPVIVQGKSEDSLLIQKLRGTASGERMPRGRDPLPEETIALVAKWIDLGARFDGTDANLALEETVGRSAAGRMTHDELAKHRVERAEMIWRLILPDVDASQQESKNVLVMGGVGGEILSAVARTAEEQVEKLQHLLRIPDNQALIKGRLMLFVFDKRYDYGEVGTMLEHRELPSQWRGHWSYNPLDAYGCLLLSERGEASPGLVAQQLAGAYVASLGDVPRWFAEGSARAIAAHVDARDPRVHQWDERAEKLLNTTTKPEGFLTATLPAEDSDVLAYSFVSKFLMAPATRYTALIHALQDGMSFDDAFAKYYKGTPEEIVPAWVARVAKRRSY